MHMFGITGLIVGILLILWGIFMVVIFPGPTDGAQPENIGIIGIVFGFVLIAIGILLVFL